MQRDAIGLEAFETYILVVLLNLGLGHSNRVMPLPFIIHTTFDSVQHQRMIGSKGAAPFGKSFFPLEPKTRSTFRKELLSS
jgi:hypothetical protein